MTATTTQLRGTCPICFRDHATRDGGRMVQHGYERPQGWHMNVRECSGTSSYHFGTEAGRGEAAAYAAAIRRHAQGQRERAAALRAGEVAELTVSGLRHRDPPRTITPAAGYEWERAVEAAARSADSNAKQADAAAADVEKRVAEWKPAELREVAVEKKAAVTHLHVPRYVTLCSSSIMGGQRKLHSRLTKDEAEVTCPRCLARLEARKAKA